MYVITDQLSQMGFSFNRLSTLFQRNNNEPKFNTYDYFCILIVLQKITVLVEKKEYMVEAGNMVYISPQKNLEWIDGDATQVYNIAFSSAFYEKSAKDSLVLHSELFLNPETDIFYCTFPNLEEMKVVFIDRLQVFMEHNEGLFISAARNAVERLILDGLLCLPDREKRNEDRLDDVGFVNRFRILLQKEYVQQKKVAYYAEQLNITPRKLSKMTELITGMSAKQLIIDKIVREYYKLLKFGNLTFSQMTFELGFTQESNFSNFIKTHTGKKPSDSRAGIAVEYKTKQIQNQVKTI